MESVCLDIHTVFNLNGLIYNIIINNSRPELDPSSTLLHASIQGSMAFISEYHIGETYFLVLPNPFQSFRLVPLVKRSPCLGFLDGCCSMPLDFLVIMLNNLS